MTFHRDPERSSSLEGAEPLGKKRELRLEPVCGSGADKKSFDVALLHDQGFDRNLLAPPLAGAREERELGREWIDGPLSLDYVRRANLGSR
jgi:hypothetical protein